MKLMLELNIYAIIVSFWDWFRHTCSKALGLSNGNEHHVKDRNDNIMGFYQYDNDDVNGSHKKNLKIGAGNLRGLIALDIFTQLCVWMCSKVQQFHLLAFNKHYCRVCVVILKAVLNVPKYYSRSITTQENQRQVSSSLERIDFCFLFLFFKNEVISQ